MKEVVNKRNMKHSICLISILSIFLLPLKAQKLDVTKLVNTIYFDVSKTLNIDTVLFVNNCDAEFYHFDTNKSNVIKVIKLNSLEDLKNYLKGHEKIVAFRIRIMDISSSSIKCHVGLYNQTNQDANFYTFIDERTITCTYSKSGWVFSKTLSVIDH